MCLCVSVCEWMCLHPYVSEKPKAICQNIYNGILCDCYFSFLYLSRFQISYHEILGQKQTNNKAQRWCHNIHFVLVIHLSIPFLIHSSSTYWALSLLTELGWAMWEAWWKKLGGILFLGTFNFWHVKRMTLLKSCISWSLLSSP